MVHAQSGLDAAAGKTANVSAALRRAQADYRDVVSTQGKASAEAFSYAAKIAGLESDLEAATDAQKRYQQQLTNTTKVTERVRQRTSELASRVAGLTGALNDLGGPIATLGQKVLMPAKAFLELRQNVGGTNATLITGGAFAVRAGAALAGAATMALQLAAGAVAATAAVAALAIGLADTARTATLASEAFGAIHPAVADVDFGAITAATNLSSDALRGLVVSLEDAQVTAADMPAALRAAALAEKALGQGGASKFVQQIKDGSLAVSEFASETQQKFGGIVQRQLLGLGDQAVALKRNLSGLFGGLDIEEALQGISKFVAMLSESHVVGRTIKFFFESMFQPLVDGLDEAYYAVEAFALGFLIGMTKVYIAVKPVIAAVAEFLGFDDPSLSLSLESITDIGEMLVPVFLAIAAAFAVVIAAGVAVGAALAAVPIVVGAALQGIVSFITGAVDWIRSIDMGQVATDLWQGFIAGIVAFGPNVVGAITGVVGGAINAAKGLLGISSPSKVFTEIGVNTGEGFAGGVDDTATEAQTAMSAMVEPPPVPVMPSAMASVAPAVSTPDVATSESAGSSIDLSGVVFNFYGVEGAEQAEVRFSELLTRMLEGDVAQLGAA